MVVRTRLLSALILASAWMCTPGWSAPDGDLDHARKGDVLYTRFSLFYQKGCHVTTNYRQGDFLPVNSRVTFVKTGQSRIYFTLENGVEFCVDNVREYSGEDINGIFRRTFSATETDLSQFTDSERKAIASGQARKGMSKAAVLIALGYPPKHRTPSLESDSWRYWASKYDTFLVDFENDKVVETID